MNLYRRFGSAVNVYVLFTIFRSDRIFAQSHRATNRNSRTPISSVKRNTPHREFISKLVWGPVDGHIFGLLFVSVDDIYIYIV